MDLRPLPFTFADAVGIVSAPDARDAYALGWDSGMGTGPHVPNPFPPSDDRIAWRKGFDDALNCRLDRLEERLAHDPRDPHPTRTGIFRLHNCWRCENGAKPCVSGAANLCGNPRARND